jgi:lipopolysaccharide biosynthesis protein
MTDVKYIAMHLPQFHPIPENDAWWGAGFTEWTNVTKARPRFRGHEQPQLPADLGYYDLRLPEARHAQAALAHRYGIDGFCYYHYWFAGQRLLERPVNEILSSGAPTFPFCLCWANESWTRRWDGGAHDVLIAQQYSEADDIAHFNWLLSAFRDPRYIRVEGKPLFLIYRAQDVTTLRHLTATWQRLAREAGLPGLCLINVRNGWSEHLDPRDLQLQGSMKFHPFWPTVDHVFAAQQRRSVPARVRTLLGTARTGDRVISYPRYVDAAMAATPPDYLEFPSVVPRWDNSPRRARDATILHGSTPALFGRWLQHETQRAQQLPTEHRIVFVNAWNEWAEGNHLEPDLRHGLSYLEAVRHAKTLR